MRKQGSLIPLGPNKWLSRVYLGTTGGKRRYSAKTLTGTTSEARKAHTKRLREIDTGTFIEPSKQTVEEYLTDWLKSKAAEISERTYSDYAHRLRLDVYPAIGTAKLDHVSAQRLQSLCASLTTDRKLAPRTIQYTFAILHEAFERACEWNLLARNPVKYVSLPKRVKTPPQVLTAEDTVAILKATAESEWNALWRLLLTSGLRPQEAAALKWTDLEDGVLSVSRTMKKMAKGKYEVRDYGKTTHATRKLTLPQSTVDALTNHKSRQSAAILKAGPAYQRLGYCFTRRNGAPLDPNAVSKLWKKDLEDAEIEHRRLYTTRHSHISHLLDAGVNVKVVADRAGHGSAGFTLDRYAHSLPGADQRAAEATEDYLRIAK